MKKLIALITVIAMLISFASLAPASGALGEVTHGYLSGDADDDGKVTMKDVLLIRKYLLGLAGEKDICLLAANADNDESTTMKDTLAIRQILLGLTDSEGNNVDDMYKVDTVTVAGRNVSRYTIVIPEEYNACMEYSASQLSKYINRACGVTLNVTSDESAVGGYKIKYAFDGADAYSLGKEGYRIEVGGDGEVMIYCGSMRGPMYATYYLLEEFIGFRFLPAKDDHVEYLYEAENVDLPAGFNETEIPVLSYRAASQGGINHENFQYMRDNSVDGSTWGSLNAKYGWGVGTLFIHAHSYMYQCGTDWDRQPCLTSEETYNQIVEYNLNLLAQRESWGQHFGEYYTQISCSPNDNANFCGCKQCKAVYAEEGSVSGTVFRLSNRVAERMEQDYPGIEVFTIASIPPKLTRPRENVCVCLCFGGCNNHAYDDVESCVECGGNPRLVDTTIDGDTYNSSNINDLKYFSDWTELTNNIIVWYYSANFCYYMAPAPNLFNIYNDFRYIASSGAIGIYSEGSTSPYYSFEYLRGYMAARMMWDPFMSEEEFNGYLNEYLMIYYGDGWQYVREYIEMSNHASDILGCWRNNFDRPFNMYSEEYFRDNYSTMSDLFDKAIEAARTEEQKKRLGICRLHCDFLGLSATYERDYVNGDAAAREKYAEHYNYLYDTIVKNDILITTSDGDGYEYGCLNFPSSHDTVVNPMTWIYDDFTGYWQYQNGRWV